MRRNPLSLALAAALVAGAYAMQTSTGAQTVRVQLIVVTPDADALQPAVIYCATSLDGWQPAGRPLRRIAPGVYETAWRLPCGTRVEYKFLRLPSWETVEKDGAGNELRNRAIVVGDALLEQVVVHRVERWADRAPATGKRVDLSLPGDQPPMLRENTLTGDVRFHHRVYSPQLRNERTIAVYLPPGYDADPRERYPVLYLNDGNNVFDARTSFTGVEWGADETAERLILAGAIRKLIIVGIYNNPERVAEYTPTRDAQHGGGSGDAYVAFIADTLKPFIDTTYRTLPDAPNTAIGGSSLGGLISLYAALRHPQVFGQSAVISPAAWWGGHWIVGQAQSSKPSPRPRLWIDIGTREGRPGGNTGEASGPVESCRRLVEALRERGYRDGVDLKYEEVPDGRHHESDWAQRFDRVLTFLFPAGKP